MKLTSIEARKILENARRKAESTGWIDHSICVGDSAGRIAEALNKKGYDLDIDKAITLGYIHDIGKMVGPFHGHVMNGYEYMKNQGYDEEYCNICLTHSYLNNDINCTAGGIPDDIPFRTNFIKNHEYTLYEKIINLCDLISNTQYHIKETYKLKEYFDNLLGYNLYDLFPEIKDNL